MDDEYDVGYGKPPKATQFKPGRSGNPNGRPKKSRNIKALVNQDLNSIVQIKENGVAKKMTMLELFSKSLVQRAVKGEHRAAQMVLQLINDVPEEVNFQVELEDFAALEKFRARNVEGAKE